VRAPVALIGVDGDGYVVFVTAASRLAMPDAVGSRRTPRIAGAAPATTHARADAGTRARRPPSPPSVGAAAASTALRGRPYILIFFLYTCPHCHHALEFLKAELAKLPEAARPKLIGVSVAGAASVVQEKLKEDGLDFFPSLRR
jgi:hypothetical protein